MTIKSDDLGAFAVYRPDALPMRAPPNTLFCRREADGADWYGLIHGEAPVLAAEEGTVYAFGVPMPEGGFRIGAASDDPTMLFPAGGHLLRLHGVEGFSHELGLASISGHVLSPDGTLTPPEPA